MADGIGKSQPRGARLGRQRSRLQCQEQRNPAPGGFDLVDVHCLGAEAARRHIDHPPERLVSLCIVRRCRESEQSEGVLDFGSLIEADIADQRVGDARMHQRLLEAARERVAAVEDRHVVPREAFGAAASDFRDDAGGLSLRVAEADDLDRIAARFARKPRLAKARGILGDDGVGGAEDVAG
jgi:hypothetical protein